MHTSKIHSKNQNDYKQYRYLNYDEIVERMKELAKQYPDLIKLDTAQRLYGLPYPGGYCNLKNKT